MAPETWIVLVVLLLLALGCFGWKYRKEVSAFFTGPVKRSKVKPHHLARRKKPLRHAGRRVPA